MTRRGKIVCTLGPATQRDDLVRALVEAGMDVARMNFSHGDYDDHRPPIGRPLPQPERCADEVPGHKMATGWNGNQPNPDALTSQTTKPSRLASPAGSIFFRNPDAHATPGRCLRCPTAT